MFFKKKNQSPCMSCPHTSCPNYVDTSFKAKVRRFCYINEGAFVAVDLIGILLVAWILGIVPFSYADESLEIVFPKVEVAQGAETDYYRSTLTEQEQGLYDQIEDGYRSLARAVYPKDKFDQETVRKVHDFVLYDNPDIWWAENTAYCMSNIWGVSSIALGYYDYDYDTIAEKRAEYDQIAQQAADEILSQTTEASRDSVAASLAYMWVIQNCDYSDDVHNSQNVDSAFGDGKSVCSGYAKAYKYILDKAGVPCVFVVGGTNRTEDSNHAWNMVYADGSILYVDATWGDKGGDEVKWNWFAVDPVLFAADHYERYADALAGIWGRTDSKDWTADMEEIAAHLVEFFPEIG